LGANLERFSGFSPELRAYTHAHSSGIDDLARELMQVTDRLGNVATMRGDVEVAALLAWLVRLSKPRLVVEVGTFTGFCSLAMARALPPQGRLLCCDTNEEWVSIGRGFWERAGVAELIDVVIAPAIETLQAMPTEPIVDFAFIDADKGSYISYYEELLARLSPRGVIAVDNVTWSGLVLEPENSSDGDLPHILAFNNHIKADPRVTQVMLPIGDGLTLITHAP